MIRGGGVFDTGKTRLTHIRGTPRREPEVMDIPMSSYSPDTVPGFRSKILWLKAGTASHT